jgi:hypothetical protein
MDTNNPVEHGLNLCGERLYGDYDEARLNRLRERLIRAGMIVTGSNPYEIDTKQHGVALRSLWRAHDRTLLVIVTAKAWYATCAQVWEQVDSYVKPAREAMSEKNQAALQQLGHLAPKGIAAEAELGPGNDLVKVEWEFVYEREHGHIVSVFNVTPRDPSSTQIQSAGSAITSGRVMYAASMGGQDPACPGTCMGFTWTNNLGPHDRGRSIAGYLEGLVLHNGSSKQFVFKKQTTIPNE